MSFHPKEDMPKIARRDAAIARAVKGGMSPADAAVRFGLNPATIYEICHKQGLRFGRNGNAGKYALGPGQREALAEAVRGGLPVSRAAAQFGQSLGSSYRICREYGLRFGVNGNAGAMARRRTQAAARP